MKRIIILFILPYILLAQTREKYPQATEMWSKPEEIKAISNWAGSVEHIAVSADGKTLYISVSGVAVTQLSDTGWTTPYKLGSHINRDYYVRAQAITPSGKRLFYTWRIGDTWYLFYSDWDSIKNDWGEPMDCGPEVNQSFGIGGVTAPNDSIIVFTRYESAYIASYNTSTKQYANVKDFPSDGLNFVSAYGIAYTQNPPKVYYLSTQTDTTLDGRSYLKWELIVKYGLANSSDYTRAYVLNISYQADTLYYNGEYVDRGQAYPTLTADGKTLFFVANYHGKQTVYVTHMLIDENGIPVSVNDEPSSLPSSFFLYPPYPNPFNPTTTIRYTIPALTPSLSPRERVFAGQVRVTLVVYDVLGRVVATLVNEEKLPGNYEVKFDASRLSSGVYIYKITADDFVQSKKMLLMK